MGYWLGKSMGYGLWGPFSCEPSWWMQNAMGFEGLWVLRGMG